MARTVQRARVRDRNPKRAKNGKHCIKSHRLVPFGGGRGKITEAQMCTKFERLRNHPIWVHQFNMMFACVYEVAELLGGVGTIMALNIMPFLVHRGESEGMFTPLNAGASHADGEMDVCPYWYDDYEDTSEDMEWINALIVRQHQDRYSRVPTYLRVLEMASKNTHAMNGLLVLHGDNRELYGWASCDEECTECEFVDVCAWGKCICPFIPT